MKMKFIYFVLSIFMFSFAMNMSAQEKTKKESLTPEQRIEIRAKRLSEKLMLDEATSAKFVPLYTSYMSELQDVRNSRKEAKRGEMSDAQIVEKLKSRFSDEATIAEIKESYVSKFSKILTARQLEKVFSYKGDKTRFDNRKPQGKKAFDGKKNKRSCAPCTKEQGACTKEKCATAKQ